MILKKYHLGFLALFVLVGCSSPILNPTSASIVKEDSSSAASTLSPFIVTLSLPQTVKINEKFSIKASLKTETLSNLEISSRTQLFTYNIKNEIGNQIHSYAVTDGGIARILNG